MKTPARTFAILGAAFIAALGFSCGIGIGTRFSSSGGKVAGFESASPAGLDESLAALARDRLDIAYWHTSHGSQITTGMEGMDAFFGGTGAYAVGGEGGLRLVDNGGTDLGANADFSAETRAWLASHPETNVIMWSWCGQVSGMDESAMRANYLDRMASLESEYPSVVFIYMTGHADGSGEEGNLHARNAQIRQWCEERGSWLYDFYEIECYDPDGTYFGDRHVTDGCDYDGGNWAIEWQDAHPGEWWECSAAHSQPLNANRKAIAAWQLFSRIARTVGL